MESHTWSFVVAQCVSWAVLVASSWISTLRPHDKPFVFGKLGLLGELSIPLSSLVGFISIPLGIIWGWLHLSFGTLVLCAVLSPIGFLVTHGMLCALFPRSYAWYFPATGTLFGVPLVLVSQWLLWSI